MTYDHELTLISYKFDKDNIGQEIETDPVKRKILCSVKSIGRNEFYAAAQAGLRPSITFVIHGYEYNGEETVEFEGKRYKVIRTYAENFEELELICEKVIGHD